MICYPGLHSDFCYNCDDGPLPSDIPPVVAMSMVSKVVGEPRPAIHFQKQVGEFDVGQQNVGPAAFTGRPVPELGTGTGATAQPTSPN